MRWFFVVTGILLAICGLSILAGSLLAQAVTPANAFVQQLALDTSRVDGQWAWREIVPGRDTVQLTLDRLEGDDTGFFQQIDYDQIRIQWTTNTSPAWHGSVISRNNQSSRRVYSVVIRPIPGDLKLGDVLLIFGRPSGGPIPFDDTYNLCFSDGVCITVRASRGITKLQPDDKVMTLTFLTKEVVRQKISEVN
jgi:hypothetical protein